MEYKKNLNFDLMAIVKAFHLVAKKNCEHLNDWMQATYPLSGLEQNILSDLHTDISNSINAMNEEELKARVVGILFYGAKIDVDDKIRVFYERALSATINGIPMGVICDCMVATPIFNLPEMPYFFLQEFKKSKGEKKDPEAQMLVAMLIAQHQNQDNKPIYGCFLLGSSWHFTTLIGQNYCISRKYEASNNQDLEQIFFSLKQLKELILNR
ncbi:MAG: hypothetical protein RLZZ292_3195 [Bacteroidota bacterium]|jgi:hypothetical protein